MANYREIFEKIPDGIVLHDVADGSFLEANQQFCDILGYPRDELLAMDFGAIHVDEPPYTTERAEEYLQRAAEEGPQSFEWRVETKRGGARPVEVHLRRTSNEEESRVLAVVRDIRERKRRQRELRRIRDQMEFVLEATDTIIWTLDLSSEQSTEYGPIDRLFGTEPDGMADFLSEIVHPADRGAVERVYEAVRTGETDVYEVEFRVKDAADGERWFAAKGHVREVPGEDSPRLSGLATEVTDRKRRKEELHRQKDRLEEFTQVVSHDLRNPLNVAEARLELAREESETPHHDDIERAH